MDQEKAPNVLKAWGGGSCLKEQKQQEVQGWQVPEPSSLRAWLEMFMEKAGLGYIREWWGLEQTEGTAPTQRGHQGLPDLPVFL